MYGTGSETRSQKRARQQADKDLEEVLDLPAGRRVIMRLLEASGVMRRAYADGTDTFFNEGRRAVGIELIEHMERVMPDAFIALQVEMAKLRKLQDRSTEEQQDDA